MSVFNIICQPFHPLQLWNGVEGHRQLWVHPATWPNNSHWWRSLGFPYDGCQGDHPGVCHAIVSRYILMNTASHREQILISWYVYFENVIQFSRETPNKLFWFHLNQYENSIRIKVWRVLHYHSQVWPRLKTPWSDGDTRISPLHYC